MNRIGYTNCLILLFLLFFIPSIINAQTYRTADGTLFKDKYDALRYDAKMAARAEEKEKEEKEKKEKKENARREAGISKYEPGAGWRTSTRVWREEKYELDYRSQAKKAKSKEAKGLEFKYPKGKGVEVTHENEGIAVFDNSVFHDHRKKKDWWHSYNNFLYELDYSFKENSDSSFGFGMQFIGKNDDLHDCNDYTFFSFFVSAGGKLMYYKKRMGKNDKFTSGFFPELKDDIPEMFELSNYRKASQKISLADTNHLFISQWKNELIISINGQTIYQDRLSRCPVQLSQTPYNLFLNKGAVIFYKGEEMYVEKRH